MSIGQDGVHVQDQADSKPASPHRQWGAERPRPPLPAVETPASVTATWLGGVAIAATILAWLTYIVRTVITGFANSAVTPMPPLRQTLSWNRTRKPASLSRSASAAWRRSAAYQAVRGIVS